MSDTPVVEDVEDHSQGFEPDLYDPEWEAED
jgi:hypothetical protein